MWQNSWRILHFIENSFFSFCSSETRSAVEHRLFSHRLASASLSRPARPVAQRSLHHGSTVRQRAGDEGFLHLGIARMPEDSHLQPEPAPGAMGRGGGDPASASSGIGVVTGTGV